MKNLIKKGLFIALLSLTMVAKASDNDGNIKLTVINSKYIDLKLQNFDGDLVISVKDKKGQILYSENHKGDNFSKKYDIQTLPVGDYFFEIEGQTKIKSMQFKVTAKEVVYNNTIETIYYKPIVRRNNELLYVSKVVFENEMLSIVLLDENSNVIYDETLRGETLGKILNLKDLHKGSYKLVLKSGNRVFNEQITIEK
jgi:hypothetical protein